MTLPVRSRLARAMYTRMMEDNVHRDSNHSEVFKTGIVLYHSHRQKFSMGEGSEGIFGFSGVSLDFWAFVWSK